MDPHEILGCSGRIAADPPASQREFRPASRLDRGLPRALRQRARSPATTSSLGRRKMIGRQRQRNPRPLGDRAVGQLVDPLFLDDRCAAAMICLLPCASFFAGTPGRRAGAIIDEVIGDVLRQLLLVDDKGPAAQPRDRFLDARPRQEAIGDRAIVADRESRIPSARSARARSSTAGSMSQATAMLRRILCRRRSHCRKMSLSSGRVEASSSSVSTRLSSRRRPPASSHNAQRNGADYDLGRGKLLDDCGELPEIALGDVGETGGEQLILAAMTGRQRAKLTRSAHRFLRSVAPRTPASAIRDVASSMIPRLAFAGHGTPPIGAVFTANRRDRKDAI